MRTTRCSRTPRDSTDSTSSAQRARARLGRLAASSSRRTTPRPWRARPASDVPESAATSGPIRSSASSSAFASSGESRAGRRKSSPYSSFSTATIVLVLDELGVDRVAAAAEADEVQQLQVLLERLGHEAVARRQRHRGDARARLVAAARPAGRPSAPAAPRSARARPGSRRRVRAARSTARRARSARRAAGPAPSCARATRSSAGRDLVDAARAGPSGTAWPSRSSSQRASRRASANGRLEDERAVVLVGGRCRGGSPRARRARRRTASTRIVAISSRLAELPRRRGRATGWRRTRPGCGSRARGGSRSGRRPGCARAGRCGSRRGRGRVRRGTTGRRAGTGCRDPSCASTARRTRSPSTGRRSCAASRRPTRSSAGAARPRP